MKVSSVEFFFSLELGSLILQSNVTRTLMYRILFQHGIANSRSKSVVWRLIWVCCCILTMCPKTLILSNNLLLLNFFWKPEKVCRKLSFYSKEVCWHTTSILDTKLLYVPSLPFLHCLYQLYLVNQNEPLLFTWMLLYLWRTKRVSSLFK